MMVFSINSQKLLPVSFLLLFVFILLSENANATAQCVKNIYLPCNPSHTVSPGLNSCSIAESFFSDDLQNLFEIRINIKPSMLETNSFQKDSASKIT